MIKTQNYYYCHLSAKEIIAIKDEEYRYIFKVKRHRIGEIITLRNLKDNYIYFYKIEKILKKEAILTLQDKKELIVKPEKFFHLGWCIIDPKIVEKTLPMLNEIGVGKISFVYCQRSQKNFKINLDRIEKILINSSQQCGRSMMMEVEILNNLNEYFKLYPTSAVLDFNGKKIEKNINNPILVGCEGGFSNEEKKIFSNKICYNLSTPLVLRSESAAVTVSVMQELGHKL